jgi:uncharacterized delta-60 repeat protein
LDNGYNPVLSIGAHVNALAVESGDRLLIGGTFTTVNGTSRKGIARLNSDGSLDSGFNPGTGASGVQSILVETNGKIVIGGLFTTFNGTSRIHLAGINDDGSLDTNFNVGAGLNFGSPTTVDTLALQPDGKVLIGGNFETYNGLAAECVARLNTDGSLDTNFNTRTLNSAGFGVYAMALQPDGKVLLGGNFPQIDSTNRNYIARINTNGSLDTTFNPGIGGMAPLTPYVYSIALQTNGEVVVGGGFTSMNDAGRWYVARLHGDAPEINPTGPTNGGRTLQWTAIPGRTYRVQFTTSFDSAGWSDLPPDILAVTNLASTTDPVTNTHRFYRVALLPLP